MKRYYNPNYQYIYTNNNQRFIGPILPFVGGALIGYIAGRPNFPNYYYPVYYPTYYPTYSITNYNS